MVGRDQNTGGNLSSSLTERRPAGRRARGLLRCVQAEEIGWIALVFRRHLTRVVLAVSCLNPLGALVAEVVGIDSAGDGTADLSLKT